MKKTFLLISLAGLLIASIVFMAIHLSIPPLEKQNNPVTAKVEEYVYVAVFLDDPMIMNHDVKGLEQFAEEYGVNVRIVAPQKVDVEIQKQLILDVIEERPDGLMVCGTDHSLTPYVNMAIEAGIPTITVDADLPQSKRLAFIGSDWFDIGVRQAEAMVKMIGGKGTVAIMGMTHENMQEGYLGYKSVMENYENVIVLDEYNDESNPEKAKELTEEIIIKYPDIAGISGFDSNSGFGIAEALQELGLGGEIKVTCVDMTEQHLDLVRQDLVQKLIGQKRELFTYYGCKLLYDYNHSGIKVDGDDKQMINIPFEIDTGLIEVDRSNVDDV